MRAQCVAPLKSSKPLSRNNTHDTPQVTDQFSDTVRAVSGGFFLSMFVVFALSMFGIRVPGFFSSGESGRRLGWAALRWAGLGCAGLGCV